MDKGKSRRVFRTGLAVTLFVLLGCRSAWCSPPGQPFSIVFSGETQLLVKAAEETAACREDDDRCQNGTTGSSVGPSLQSFSSVVVSQDPGSPCLLVCLLSGLDSPVQDVLWWVDDGEMTLANSQVSLLRSEEGGAYSTILVWEVSAANWRAGSTYWCGTNQAARVFKHKLCSQDCHGFGSQPGL